MIYLDGGDIYWSAGMDSGTYGPPISYGKILFTSATHEARR